MTFTPLSRYSAFVGGTAVARSGRVVAAAAALPSPRQIDLWHPPNPKPVSSINVDSIPDQLALSPDGRLLAGTTYGLHTNGTVTLWDTAADRLLAQVRVSPPGGANPNIAFDPTRDALLISSDNAAWELDLDDASLIVAACKKAASTFSATHLASLISGPLANPCTH